MRRRIVIELDAEEGADRMVKDITGLVMGRIDNDVEFSIRHEFIPDAKQRAQVQIPGFLGGGRRREA